MSNEFQLVYSTCTDCKVCRPIVVIGVSSNGQFDFYEGWNTDKVWHEIQVHKAIIQDENGKNYSCTQFIASIEGKEVMIEVHFNKLADGSMWLVNAHGIHSCYQTQATHYAKDNRLIPIGEDETIPCSIPQELADAVHNVIDWSKGCLNLTPNENLMFTFAETALTKALRGQCTMHQSLQRQQELEDAEELLTKVCHKFDNDVENFDIQDVPGLIEWWAKRKPKSEREKKLEKIENIICQNKRWTVEEQAAEILKALEEG